MFRSNSTAQHGVHIAVKYAGVQCGFVDGQDLQVFLCHSGIDTKHAGVVGIADTGSIDYCHIGSGASSGKTNMRHVQMKFLFMRYQVTQQFIALPDGDWKTILRRQRVIRIHENIPCFHDGFQFSHTAATGLQRVASGLVAEDKSATVKVHHNRPLFPAVIGIPDVREAVGIGFAVFDVAAANHAVFQRFHFRSVPRFPFVGLMSLVELCVNRFLHCLTFEIVDELSHICTSANSNDFPVRTLTVCILF